MTQELEIWKDIEGFEGSYQVSNLGRVNSLHSNRSNQGGILKPKPHPQGYLCVNLYSNKKRKTELVHRLVALAFVDGDKSLMTNHKDGVKTNNHYLNLEWCTQSENVQHAHDTNLIPTSGAKGSKNGRAKVTEQIVVEIRLLKGTMPVKDICERYKISVSSVERIIYNKGWKHVA